MGWCCCCCGGGVAVWLETRGSGRGFGPKTRNRAVVAWFRARRVKRQRGTMGRGGGWGRQGDGGSGVARWAAQAGVVGLGPKPETGLLGLGLGCTVGNSGGGRWGEVVGW